MGESRVMKHDSGSFDENKIILILEVVTITMNWSNNFALLTTVYAKKYCSFASLSTLYVNEY